MELEPVVFGPPAYGSPDPATAGNTLLPLVDNPMATAEEPGAAEGNGDAAAAKEPNDRLAGDWKAMIDACEDEDALEALQAEYEESDADFSTVEDAFDKKAEELAAAAENGNGS